MKIKSKKVVGSISMFAAPTDEFSFKPFSPNMTLLLCFCLFEPIPSLLYIHDFNHLLHHQTVATLHQSALL